MESKDTYFKVDPRGGPGTAKRTGVGIDTIRARAVDQDTKQWCVRYGLGQTATFEINLYGQEGAIAMAREWSSRMSYFYDLWLEHGASDKHKFDEAERGSYVESPDFAAFARSLEKPAAKKRLESLRNVKPNAC